MLGNNLHKHEADERVRWYLANREVVLHLIYPVLDGQVDTSFESLDLALHATAGPALGSMQRSTVNDELAPAFRIDVLFALALVWVAVVRVVWGSIGGQTRLLASGRT